MKARQTFLPDRLGPTKNSYNLRSSLSSNNNNNNQLISTNTIQPQLTHSLMTSREIRHNHRQFIQQSNSAISSATNLPQNNEFQTIKYPQNPQITQPLQIISPLKTSSLQGVSFSKNTLNATSETDDRQEFHMQPSKSRVAMSVEPQESTQAHNQQTWDQINSSSKRGIQQLNPSLHQKSENPNNHMTLIGQSQNPSHQKLNFSDINHQTQLRNLVNLNANNNYPSQNPITQFLNTPDKSTDSTPNESHPLTREQTNKRAKRFRNELIDINNIIVNHSSKRRLTRRLVSQLSPNLLISSDNERTEKLDKLVKRSRQYQQSQPQQEQGTSSYKSCSICLGQPDDNSYGRIACAHVFCLECISQWALITNQCPMCRKEFFEILAHGHFQSNKNTIDISRIPVEPKKQRIPDEDEFYWEEASADDQEDEICYVCETDYDQAQLLICDSCEVRICHSYCDNDLFDDSVPSEEWFCHECRLRTHTSDS